MHFRINLRYPLRYLNISPSPLFTLCLFVFGTVYLEAQAKPTINYQIDCQQPHSHYFTVTMTLDGFKDKEVEVKMPVWIPGSYMVREFSKNVEGFSAKNSSNQPLAWEKTHKNTWKVKLDQGKAKISYLVYAYELSVRSSYLDIDHAFINPSSVLLFVEKYQNQASTLRILPWYEWKKATTALALVQSDNPWEFKSTNYDELADSPIECGNQSVFHFKVKNVPHRMAIFGFPEADTVSMAKDLQRICETAAEVIGEIPLSDYTFLVHAIPNAGGGLEHSKSSALQTNRQSLMSEPGYTGFLNLVAHEYFHLWNVKRIRPKALGPFDYDQENYTHLLWFSEGFTSYYDDYILRRAGFYDENKFIETISGGINYNENTQGSQIQSLSESSWDAWIKYYRPNENSSNSTISYYNKGALIAALLDIKIIAQTQGEKSLDNVLQYLYKTYYKEMGRGFTDEELQRAFETVLGLPLDDFFKRFIQNTEKPDYASYLALAGLQIQNLNEKRTDPWLGISLQNSGGKSTVSQVTRNSPAWKFGIYVNDEIIAINNQRVSGDLSPFLYDKKPGDVLVFLVARDGFLRTISLTLGKSENVNFKITKIKDATEAQKRVYARWMFSEK